MSLQSKAKPGTQAIIQITKFAGDYAQGTVSNSDKSLVQQFMVIKAGENWKIIAHNNGGKLDLPNIETAIKYQLPKGWHKD